MFLNAHSGISERMETSQQIKKKLREIKPRLSPFQVNTHLSTEQSLLELENASHRYGQTNIADPVREQMSGIVYCARTITV